MPIWVQIVVLIIAGTVVVFIAAQANANKLNNEDELDPYLLSDLYDEEEEKEK